MDFQLSIPNTSKEISHKGLDGLYLPLNTKSQMWDKFDVRYILLGPRKGLSSQNNTSKFLKKKKKEILLYSNSSRRKCLHLRKVTYIPLSINRSVTSDVPDISTFWFLQWFILFLTPVVILCVRQQSKLFWQSTCVYKRQVRRDGD